MSIDIGRLNPDQRRAMDSQTIRQLETRAKAAEARETELRSLVGPEALSHRLALDARVAELEAVLEEAEIEVSVAAHRLHFEDIALAPDRADDLADLCERLRVALKGKDAQ